VIADPVLEAEVVKEPDPKVPDTVTVQPRPPVPAPPVDPASVAGALAASAKAEAESRVPDFDDDDLPRAPVQPPQRRKR
jgi:hypothetical protein